MGIVRKIESIGTVADVSSLDMLRVSYETFCNFFDTVMRSSRLRYIV